MISAGLSNIAEAVALLETPVSELNISETINAAARTITIAKETCEMLDYLCGPIGAEPAEGLNGVPEIAALGSNAV